MGYGKQKIQTLETNFDSYVKSGDQENIWVLGKHPKGLARNKILLFSPIGKELRLTDQRESVTTTDLYFSLLFLPPGHWLQYSSQF